MNTFDDDDSPAKSVDRQPSTLRHPADELPTQPELSAGSNSDVQQALRLISYHLCTSNDLSSDRTVMQSWLQICHSLKSANSVTGPIQHDIATLSNTARSNGDGDSQQHMQSSHSLSAMLNNHRQTGHTSPLHRDTQPTTTTTNNDTAASDNNDDTESIATVMSNNHMHNVMSASTSNTDQPNKSADHTSDQCTDEHHRHYDMALQTWRGDKPVFINQKSLDQLRHHYHCEDEVHNYKYWWFVFRRDFCNVTSVGHRCWATAIVITVLWFSVITPFQMAFFSRLDFHETSRWLEWVGFTLDLLFILDIIKSLFTGYNSDDFLGFNFKRNLIQYASDGTLFVDLLSITYTPFVFISTTAFSAAWGLVRLTRWYKVSLYLKHILRNNVASKSYETGRMVKYFAVIVVLLHIAACAYIYMAYVEMNSGETCTWLSDNSLKASCTGQGLASSSYVTIYINAFFYACASLVSDGYGVAVPLTPPEWLYTGIYQVIGQVYFAFLVAKLVSILSSNDAVHSNFRGKLRSVNALLEYKNVPSEMRERVTDYYQYAFHQRKTYPFFQQDVFNDLSNSLRRNILTYVNKPLLDQVFLLRGCDSHFLRRLMSCITQLILVPGDYLVIQGDINTSMLFITKGVCEVRQDGNIIGNLTEGQHFGEMVLVEDTGVRPATVVALTHCDVSMLQRTDIKSLYLDFPDQKEYIRKAASDALHHAETCDNIK